MGFHPSTSDPSLFIRRSSSGFFVLVYVDDLILACTDLTDLEALKGALKDAFPMKDLGKLQDYLGMDIEQFKQDHIITLSQQRYI